MPEEHSFEIGQSKLILTLGDITQSTADIIVSSDDTRLSMGGGVSAAIRRAAGQSLVADARKQGPAAVGDVVVTTAGNLLARHAFHAVTLEWGQKPMPNAIHRVTRRCLELATALRARSIAFPALGMGTARYPKEVVASEMVDVITASLVGRTDPLEVTIYLYPGEWTSTEVDFAPFLERFRSGPRSSAAPAPVPGHTPATSMLANLRRVGIFSAQPLKLAYLRIGQEVRAVDRAFLEAPSDYRELLWIVQAWATRREDIQGWLLRYQPHVVHFSGHGGPSGEIELENEMGEREPVPLEALGDLMQATCPDLKFVVLNACFSLSGADKLVDQVGCVVGTTDKILDDAAVAFSRGFYSALAHGFGVGEAFEQGRASVKLYRLEPDVLGLKTRPGLDANDLKLVV